MYLVRSVELEDLSEADKFRRNLIGHFATPFAQDEGRVEDLRTLCESPFEREVYDELTQRGYWVKPQVGVGEYRIDMVVEGHHDSRLAVECDGDKYHGPEKWNDDMQRQRVLERAGWVFWRCFASTFIRRRKDTLDDLLKMLVERGIEPIGAEGAPRSMHTEHRVICASTVLDGSQAVQQIMPLPEQPDVCPDDQNLAPRPQESTKEVEPSSSMPTIINNKPVSRESRSKKENGGISDRASKLGVEHKVPKHISEALPATEAGGAPHVDQIVEVTEKSASPSGFFKKEGSISSSVNLPVEPEVWFRLAHWAKEKNALTSNERAFAFKVGMYLTKKWSLSERMGKWAEAIWLEAIDLGFRPNSEKSARDPVTH